MGLLYTFISASIDWGVLLYAGVGVLRLGVGWFLGWMLLMVVVVGLVVLAEVLGIVVGLPWHGKPWIGMPKGSLQASRGLWEGVENVDVTLSKERKLCRSAHCWVGVDLCFAQVSHNTMNRWVSKYILGQVPSDVLGEARVPNLSASP